MSKPDYGEFGEPWHVEAGGDKGIYRIVDVKSRTVLARKGGEYSVEMLRIVKLVNACSGLRDEQLTRVRAVNELYEALKAVLIMWKSAPPRKLDDAITWRQNDERAEKMAFEAIALAEGKVGGNHE